MKYVALYSVMLFFTLIALILKQPWVKYPLLIIVWGDYVALMWILLQKDQQ